MRTEAYCSMRCTVTGGGDGGEREKVMVEGGGAGGAVCGRAVTHFSWDAIQPTPRFHFPILRFTLNEHSKHEPDDNLSLPGTFFFSQHAVKAP
ncbi:hypothetical protein EYF80_055837 [Liparis tanakae]|uniref:Uncharacterized protein n=1 Tax=Liparis tanakae TaxID=230148 RepID=A0A4Z2EYE0_9TELE|nr:hypothetical protein EYF80_055837 [Liparis tanakae]